MECSKSIETIRTPKAKAESHPENKNNNQKKKIALLFGFSVVEKRYIEKGKKKKKSSFPLRRYTPYARGDAFGVQYDHRSYRGAKKTKRHPLYRIRTDYKRYTVYNSEREV